MGNNPPVTACRSHARLRVRRPEAIIAAICKDLMGHCPPSLEGQGRVRIPFRGGAAELSLLADCLLMTAEAAELAGLDHIKDVLAGQLMDREIPGAADLVWQGWDGAGRRPASFRQMRVSRVAQITPRMRRITLEGAKLERFAEGDLHLRMLLPPPGMTVPEWPVIGPNGLPKWPTFGVQPVFRTYTARRVDAAAGEMDVDFVIHEGTSIGAGWAAKAKPGDAIGIIGPEGGRPAEADWYLLAGDETALPAIARTLESLPEHKCGVALVEVADALEIQQFRHPAGIELRWLLRQPGDLPGARLPEAVRRVDLPENGTLFVWTASEFGSFKSLRRHVRDERCLTPDQHLVAAYWRRTAS